MMNAQHSVDRLSTFLLRQIAVKSSENLVTHQLTLTQLKLLSSLSLCQVSPWVLVSSSESVAGLRRKRWFANDVGFLPIPVRSTLFYSKDTHYLEHRDRSVLFVVVRGNGYEPVASTKAACRRIREGIRICIATGEEDVDPALQGIEHKDSSSVDTQSAHPKQTICARHVKHLLWRAFEAHDLYALILRNEEPATRGGHVAWLVELAGVPTLATKRMHEFRRRLVDIVNLRQKDIGTVSWWNCG